MIAFNCKCARNRRYRELSAEYGGVLFEYEGARFLDPEVIDLFRRMQGYNSTEFVDALRWLQPEKRWTTRKELFWFDGVQPIRGVLATLLGTMTEKTPTGEQRRQLVTKSFGLRHISVHPPLTDDQKRQIMLRALRRKFTVPRYRALLLSTGDAVLHQTPVVSEPDMWTWRKGKGGDWMGKLLTQIRNEIR